MSETKTAPFVLPLHIEETTSPKHFYLQDTEGFLRATTEGGDDIKRNREIAAFIVQAVNAYHADQELIRELREALGNSAAALAHAMCIAPHGDPLYPKMEATLTQSYKVLAPAKAGKGER